MDLHIHDRPHVHDTDVYAFLNCVIYSLCIYETYEYSFIHSKYEKITNILLYYLSIQS